MKISEELLRSVCDQNKRCIEAGNLEFTREILVKLGEKQPILKEFIGCTASGAAKNFCGTLDLDPELVDTLTVQIVHAMAMVANAYESQMEIDELEELMG